MRITDTGDYHNDKGVIEEWKGLILDADNSSDWLENTYKKINNYLPAGSEEMRIQR